MAARLVLSGCWWFFRLVLAACFILGALTGFVSFVGSRYPDDHWPWWAGPGIAVVLIASIAIALVVFNRRGFRPSLPGKSQEEEIAELREKDLLLTESFSARRAFGVEEFEDEGLHYFVELSDGRTLYLTGQNLYDYEPIDEPDINQPRRFPCTEFTVLRHKEAGYILDILCSGAVLEPEVVAPPFSKQDCRQGLPEDGDVIADRTYDEIKAQRLGAGRG